MYSEAAMIKRLAQLWKVAPYRIDVRVDGERIFLSLDGKVPAPDLIEAFEKDVQVVTKAAKCQMN